MKPKRAFELTIKIGGDTWEDVEHQLKFTTTHLLDHGSKCNSCMGGPSADHIVEIEHDPTMTHERYHQELAQWIMDNIAGAKP